MEDLVMLLNLPLGWALSQLEELSLEPKKDIVDGPFGSNLKASEYLAEGVPILRLQNIDRNLFINNNIKFVSGKKANDLQRHNFIKGDIVITKLGEPLGKACLIPEFLKEGIIVADLVRVRVEEKYTSKKFLVYLINSHLVISQLQLKTKGTTRPRVNLGHIRELKIPLPPLNEQRRIVAKIEALKARSQRVKEALEDIPQLLDQFRQSVLAAAFRGDLTADWREQNSNVEIPSRLLENIKHSRVNELSLKSTLEEYDLFDVPLSWIWLDISHIADVKGGKRLPKGKSLINENTGYPYIRAGNLKNGTVILDEILYVPKDIQPLIKNYTISSKDVYITIVGACIGDAGIVPDEFNQANLTENAAKICNIIGCNNKYLSFWLRSPYCQKTIQSKILSAAQGKLALSRIKTIPVPIPSEEEQLEIVNKVINFLNFIDKFEQFYQQIKTDLDLFDQSILAKAFRGELVTQDPDDEPASVLLEHIRAERAKLQTKAANKSTPPIGGRRSKKASQRKAEPVQLELGLE